MSDYEPFDVENNEIRRLDMLGWYEICCDLGYQTDVISYHDILENKLNDYKMLIVPSNDCYFAEEHTDMEKMIREWVTNGGVVLHGPDCGLSKNCFGIQGIPCEKHRTYIKSLSFHRAVNFRDMRQADVLVHMQTMRANVLLCRKLKKERLFPAEYS